MTDTASAAAGPDIELFASVDAGLLRVRAREIDTLYLHLNPEERRAWREWEMLIERRTCITPSDWPSPDPARITLNPASRAMFTALRDRLARCRPSELPWSRGPSETSWMIRDLIAGYRQFTNITGAENATNH